MRREYRDDVDAYTRRPVIRLGAQIRPPLIAVRARYALFAIGYAERSSN
jgi:hypothetical protein